MYYTHKSSTLFNILCILFFIAALLAGCAEPEIEEDFAEEVFDAEAVYFEPIGQGSQASFDELTQLVVTDSTMWALYKAKMRTVIPLRDIDFSRLMVVFAAVPSANGGVTVQFESAERVDGKLVLSYVLGVPGPDCRVIDTPSVPFQVMITRKIDVPVKFETREENQYCTMG